MNCQKFENVVSELAGGRMIAAEQRVEALAHGEACEDCASRLRDEEMLTHGLRSLSAKMEPLSAPSHVENNVLAAFRARQIVDPAASRKNSRYWLAAIAAVLLIAVSVVAIRWRTAQAPSPTVAKTTPAQVAPEIAVTPPGDDLAGNVEQQPKSDLPNQPLRRPVRRASVRRPAAQPIASRVNTEIATDFMPLSYMSAANLQDGGQIVRVELPRSALATFGLPVNMDRYNEKVKADVLFGVDGMAHAIRFVQ